MLWGVLPCIYIGLSKHMIYKFFCERHLRGFRRGIECGRRLGRATAGYERRDLYHNLYNCNLRNYRGILESISSRAGPCGRETKRNYQNDNIPPTRPQSCPFFLLLPACNSSRRCQLTDGARLRATGWAPNV